MTTSQEEVQKIDDKMRYLGIDITFEDVSQSQSLSVYKVNHAIQCISYI